MTDVIDIPLDEPRQELDKPREPQLRDKVKLYTTIKAPIQNLINHEKNPRTIDDQSMVNLMNSLREDPEFMLARPALVNTYPGREWIVVAGNKRVEAAKELGWKEIPVMFVHTNSAKEIKWMLKDNIHQGEWDEAKRREVFTELHDSGESLTDIGMASGDIVDIISAPLEDDPDPTDDPEYQGSTPRKKAEIECPECGHKFKS